MPYVLPASLPAPLPMDTLPRALRISAADRAANSSSAPLPGVPRRARTTCSNRPGNVRREFTFEPVTPETEREPGTSAAGSGPASPQAIMLATLSSPAPLLHVSHSTPLPCLALPRARRGRRDQDSIVFPSEPNYVLAHPEPKHLPINAGKNGALRLTLDDIKSTLAGVHAEQMRPKSTTPAPSTATSLRKKSGELVKPSLKHAHTLSGGFPTQKSMSRSAPATPTTPKFVHFDAQLEHVRLFLAEQKPTAVSRGGSPTETSEGEGTEFPWHGRGGYGSSDDERTKKTLRVKSTNLAASPSIGGSDVKVESLTLSDDRSSLVGRVLVRNIAFEKWVAARFTFDLWQTTSEVSARYVETVSEGIDRFTFTIKLGDVLHRIEEKTLFIAVRYTVGGREIWDSNNGQNYMVSFAKDKPAPPANNWSTKSRTRDQMADLRSSLERAIQDDDNSVPSLQIKSRPRASVRGMSFSGFEAKKPTVESIVCKPVDPKPVPVAKFGARYDFGAAAREGPFRMPEIKAARPKVSTEVRPMSDAKMCESPRDAEDALMRLQPAPARSNGFELDSPAEPIAVPAHNSRRHHHRANYLDTWAFPAPGVKRTAPGAPVVEEDLGIPASWMAGEMFGGSMASTPSVTSSSSPSQSPSSPPEFLPSPESEMDMGPKAVEPPSDMDPTNYSSFLDRFCFFTGPAEQDYAMFGGYSEATARTLRAVSSSLSNAGSDVSAANTPRAGSPAGSCASESPRSISPLNV